MTAQAEEAKALAVALIEGEKSGVSKRRIPDILAALKDAQTKDEDARLEKLLLEGLASERIPLALIQNGVLGAPELSES